ncbi:MAG: M1 family metallopeptidase [Pyrinomonadaceae bacterium]
MLSFWMIVDRIVGIVCVIAFLGLIVSSQPQAVEQEIYARIKAFELNGGKIDVSNLTINRDRVSMNFTGTFYLTAPIEGKTTGAVFVGTGTLKAEPPPGDFEKANLKRLTKAENISSDFTNAFFRFTDDTATLLGKAAPDASAANPQATKIAAEAFPRTLKESGANIASRVAISLLNNETPGFFFATFDGGKSGRFSFVLDHQNRIPTNYFGINGGEKGLIYSYDSFTSDNEVKLAFYSEQDFNTRKVSYSDYHDLVDIEHYDMQLDLRSPSAKLGLRIKVQMKPWDKNVRAIPFSIGESLGTYEESRLKKQMRVKAVRYGNTEVTFVQEEWEGGFTIFLPKALPQGESASIEFDLEGDFLQQAQFVSNCWYPRSNTSWYPRHGYLDRATYNVSFMHSKKLKVATVGVREAETEWAEDKNVTITSYKMTQPVALVTFALGPWERHTENVKFEASNKSIPLEFNSVAGAALPIKESFILAELNNNVRYFNALFGDYPYDAYAATFHPYGFGQGFPSMLMIPPADRTSKYTFSFISHETAHQWWGNIVAWRSYRDQWLSEGFAEYSGVLYTSKRDSTNSAQSLLDEMRNSLKAPPRTMTGVGSGKLNDVGPIILGHRLNTTKTLGAYQTLIYNKGALVLRMLHFLLSDPSNGNDKAFYDMMKDFVEKYRNQSASTDDFREVASAHFARSPIGLKYRLKDLNWFFLQWVYETSMPSYEIEYKTQNSTDGGFVVEGSVIQSNVPNDFFMPIPIVFTLEGGKFAGGTIPALGPKTPFQIKLPFKPAKVEIDPSKWILYEKLSVK